MKKLYGLVGFSGFMLIIGGAGGADSVSFLKALFIMSLGLVLMLLSLALVKSHNMRLRKRRYLNMKRRTQFSEIPTGAVIHSKTPDGISKIISGKINSPELC